MPKYENGFPDYKMLANKDLQPIKINPEIIDFAKKSGEIFIHDQIDPLVDMWQHPKETLKANFEYTKIHFNPLSPMESIGNIVSESALNVGLRWVNGWANRDWMTITVMGAELGIMVLSANVNFFKPGSGLGRDSVAGRTMRFQELASGASKTEVRMLLKSVELNLTQEQVDKLLYTLRAGKMDKITIKLMNNGSVRLISEREGRLSGYQRMSFEIDKQGRTTKIVQTAFDDENKLVLQRPNNSKNNLYDVKKWNARTY